ARVNDRTGSVFGLDLDQAETKLLGNGFLNGLDRDLAGLRVDEILQNLLRIRQRDRGTDQRGVRDQPNQCAFQLTNVGADVGGDVEGYVGGHSNLFVLGLLLQDGNLGFQVRRLNVGAQTPFKAAGEEDLNLHQFLARADAGDHDPLDGPVQRVQRLA